MKFAISGVYIHIPVAILFIRDFLSEIIFDYSEAVLYAVIFYVLRLPMNFSYSSDNILLYQRF